MKNDPLKKASFTANRSGFIRITPQMVQARAGELAELKGRYACDVTQADLSQARRELTGGPDIKG